MAQHLLPLGHVTRCDVMRPVDLALKQRPLFLPNSWAHETGMSANGLVVVRVANGKPTYISQGPPWSTSCTGDFPSSVEETSPVTVIGGALERSAGTEGGSDDR